MKDFIQNTVNGMADVELPAVPPGVKLVSFDNGLTLILKEDRSAPVVSVQAWCRAGSVHEGNWLGSGASHVLEHMLFKGTSTRGPSRIDQEVQEAGGYMNAYTSFDRTVFYINVPSTGVRVAVDVLCDIMQHATLPEDELEKEKQVILREMDMNQDDPGRRSSRRLFETAYTVSPYRYTIIGYPDRFHELKRQDLLHCYHEKYAPNNVFFVVVGDFQTQKVEQQVREAYAQAKFRPLPPVVLPEEPPQIAPRELVEEAPIQLGHVHVCWHIPGLRHADTPFLELLSIVLGGGRSSRLYQELREKAGIVQSIDAWTYSPGNAGLLGMSAVVEPAQFLEARQAMLKQINQLKVEPVRQEELAKAVKQLVSATLASRKTMQGQAQDLGGCWQAAQDLNFSQRYLAAIRKATVEDLQRVAREYLTSENRNIYALMPEGQVVQPAVAVEIQADNAIHMHSLGNGLKLLIKEDHRLPFVEMRAVFRSGVIMETPANNGVGQMLAKMLMKGTLTRSAEQLATEIESVGGSLDTYSGNNSIGVSAEVLSEDTALGLDLVADVMRNPAFPSEALELERQMQLAAIRSMKDHVLQTGVLAMRRALFGDEGYGLDVQGTEESVTRLQQGDLQEFFQNSICPGKGVFAIYGDVQTAEIIKAVEKRLGTWQVLSQETREKWEPKSLTQVQRVVEHRDKKQAVVLLGFQGTTMHSHDRYAMDLLQEACSDLGSRLFLRIREKLGLAYYVGAQNFAGFGGGYFCFYAGTSPEKAAQVELEMLNEMRLLCSDGLLPEELSRAKAKLLGQKKIARQDLGSYAMTTALDELYGLGYANTEKEDSLFESVTVEDIKRVASHYLQENACVISTVLPEG